MVGFIKNLAEGEGFEPSVPYWTRRLSRAVHSTTLPPFHDGFAFEPGSGFLEPQRETVFPATGCALYTGLFRFCNESEEKKSPEFVNRLKEKQSL